MLEKRNISSLSCNQTIPYHLHHSLVTIPTVLSWLYHFLQWEGIMFMQLNWKHSQLLCRVAQTKHQLHFEKFNFESHFEDVFTGMIPADEDKPGTTCQQHSITSKTARIYSNITVKTSNLARAASLQYCCQCNTQTEAPALSICNTAFQLTHM